MTEEYIEMLIESINEYDRKFNPPYFILFYLAANQEFSIQNDIYFAVLAAKIKPNDLMIEDILYETKKQIGNIIYAADYKVMNKDDAIDQLEYCLNLF